MSITNSTFFSNVYVTFLMLFAILEKKRVKLHLMRTEHSLRFQNTSYLNDSQKRNRLRVLDLLHKYWKNEEFPINTTHRKKIPQIKDKQGTMCALAYMVHNSGESSLVEDLAQNSNYVLVDDIPDDHHLIDVITNNGISKQEAAKIQPSYSCQATIGTIHTGDPIVEFLGIILSIVGLVTVLFFYLGLSHVSYNFNRRTVRIAIILGIVVMGGGTGITYQNSIAEPFGDASFSGTYDTINIIDNVSIYYWIDGATVKVESNGQWFDITPDSDGQITIAYPPVLTVGYGESYNQQQYSTNYHNYFEDPFILVNGEEVEPPTQYNLNGYSILTIPFSENDSSIEIIGGGMCSEFIFD